MPDEILYFRADWCGPCRQVAETFEALKAKHPEIRFRKVDIDQDAVTPGQYSIKAIPTILRLHQGVEVARVTGALRPKETGQLLGL